MKQIQEIEIKKLSFLESNPRKITKSQMEKLCKSLQDDPGFLFSRPILVHEKDDKLIVYGGNQRVRAAKKLKWKHIPCIVEKDLSEDIIKERILKDNKTYGEFDFDILAGDYEISMLLDCGFEMSDLGVFKDHEDDTHCDVEELEGDKIEKDKPKEMIMCPFCGEEF